MEHQAIKRLVYLPLLVTSLWILWFLYRVSSLLVVIWLRCRLPTQLVIQQHLIQFQGVRLSHSQTNIQYNNRELNLSGLSYHHHLRFVFIRNPVIFKSFFLFFFLYFFPASINWSDLQYDVLTFFIFSFWKPTACELNLLECVTQLTSKIFWQKQI